MRVDRTSQYPPFAFSFLSAQMAILPLLEMHVVVMDLQQRVHTIDMNPRECERRGGDGSDGKSGECAGCHVEATVYEGIKRTYTFT